MRRRTVILFFLFFALHKQTINAQVPDYHVQLFDERHGLHTFLMLDVVKDQNDFTWILYRFKIQRFDGKLVKEFTFDDALFSIICDDQNNIWATSRTEFFRYSDQQKRFTRVHHDTTGKPLIGKLLKIPGYPIVCHSNNGFYAFDSKANMFKKINSGPLSFSKKFELLSADSYEKTVFVQSKDTLYSIDGRSGTVRKLAGAHDVNTFHALNEDKVILSSFNNYCYWFDFRNNTVTRIDIGKGMGGTSSYFFRAFDAEQVNATEYFITSNHGPLLYNLQTGVFRKLQLFSEGRPLRYIELVSNLNIDSQKNVWAVCSNHGLIYFRAAGGQLSLVRNVEIDKKLSWDNNVRNFAEDEKGNLWMATLNGFAYYDLKRGKITPYHPNVNDTTTYSFPSVRGIAYDGEYVILGPTNRGAWLYHVKTKTFHRPVFLQNDEGTKTKLKLENDFIDHICKLKSGDYIISARDGHYFMNGKNFLTTAIHFPGEEENGNFAFEDRSGFIWLVNQTALYRFDSAMRFVCRVPIDGAVSVTAILELEPGVFLVGGRGLHLVKKTVDNSFEVTFFDPYFKGKIISIIFRDKLKMIWLGTSEGFIRYDMKTRKPELFNFLDNVQGNMFNPRATHLTSAGVLYLGGYNGINYMEPEKVRSRNDSLKVTITRMAVNNVDTGLYDNHHFRLKHSQNTIDVEFAAPYFSSVNRVRYRYWLKGLDERWVDNGTNNSVRFSSLAPGDYQFKVAATINDENWFESQTSFSFMIRPPFWTTWWFRSLVLIAVAVSLYTFYRYQLNKKLEVERLRLSISRDLHDDIGSTLSSINILARSSLAKNSSHDESNVVLLQKIQQRSQRTLDAMDDLIWNTKPENDSLESLIIRMREYAAEVLEAAGIDFTLDCPASIGNLKLEMQQKKNLYLIFKEAVNNLAKYSNSSRALIRFEYEKKLLQMVIIDEGSGFTITSIKKGDGLDNMQSRAAEMNAQLEIKSGVGRGTTIQVDVPV